MSKWDRLSRALFVALAVGLGWGIRGDFGHMLGAMAPGAALGMGFAYVTGCVVVYLFIIFMSSFVNGEETMASANTRFPEWSWREGPFPGR